MLSIDVNETAEYPAILKLYPYNSGYVATRLRGYAATWLRGYVGKRLTQTLTLTATLTLTITLILTPTLTLTLKLVLTLTVTQTQTPGVRGYVATRTVIASNWLGILQLSPSGVANADNNNNNNNNNIVVCITRFYYKFPHYLSSHWLRAYS